MQSNFFHWLGTGPLFLFSLFAAQVHAAQSNLDSNTCIALDGQTLSGVAITSSEWLSLDATEVCVVNGHRAPFLDIEVILPQNWKQRFFLQGGSGFDGAIKSGLIRDDAGEISALHPTIVELGVARASSNGGNRSSVESEASPGVWLSGTPEAEVSLRDYAFQGLGTTIHFSRELIETAYSQAASYSYFVGCSNGGRNAYTVAERWPDEFQGISAGCEGMALGGQVAQWIALANTIDTDAALSEAQYTAAHQAAVAECDGKDGVADNLIADPAACQFDPRTLSCANSQSETCLTDAQIGTMQMLYSDFTDSQGNIIYSAYPPANFGSWVVYHGVLGGGFAWMATGNSAWFTSAEQKASYDMAWDLYRIETGLIRGGYAHDRIAIADYVVSGGKLISWHAVGDGLLSANDHLRNFEDMSSIASKMSAAQGNSAKISDHARFFMVPGGDHGDGHGPSTIDLVSALIDWAENGVAPDQLTVTRGDIQLPACAHPAKTVGKGGKYVCE